MTIIIKPETMLMYCEQCDSYQPQGLIKSTGEYICSTCGHITVTEEGSNDEQNLDRR